MSLPILPSPLGPTTPPTGQPSQQGQPTTRRNYLVIPLVLQPQMEIDVNGDWLSVLSYQADLDLSNVYVAFNYADNWLPLSAIGAGVFTPFERIYIRAAQSEVGKSLSVAIGGQARFYISSQGVTISNDQVGLAKDNTLAQIATSAAGIYSIASSNVNYPLSTMAATLSSINSYSANINAILSSNVNFPMSTMAAALHSIGTDSWQIYINGASIMTPIDLQARYKPTGFTIFSGTVTSNGSSTNVNVSLYSAVRAMVKVTSVVGTNAVLNVYLNGVYDATGDSVPLASVTGITGVGIYEIGQINDLPFNYINVSWTVSGSSPSFTITVAAQAMV